MGQGPSQASKDNEKAQSAFYAQLTKEQATTYAEQQDLLQTVKASTLPTLKGGVNQFGFSPEEDATFQSLINTGAETQEQEIAQQAAIQQASTTAQGQILQSQIRDEGAQQAENVINATELAELQKSGGAALPSGGNTQVEETARVLGAQQIAKNIAAEQLQQQQQTFGTQMTAAEETAAVKQQQQQQLGNSAQSPQPTPPPKERFGQGVGRGLGGEKYVVDATGKVESARTTAPSAKGEFGSILGGIVFGALQGASRARPGGIPSHEIGGGFGAGVGAAEDAADQRDDRNRTQAEQTFSNQQQVQKQSREQLESAAQIQHLAAQTASELSATQRADDEHPLNMALKKAGLDEAAVNIQKGHQELMTNSLGMMQTLIDNGIEPTALPNNWNDARPHVTNIVQGKTLPIFNGKMGEDSGVGMFDVQQLRNTPIMKEVTFKTFSADKDGNPVEKVNTLPAGTSAFSYVESAMEGRSQLKQILSAQSVKQAAELHKATIREKNAATSKDISDAKLADAKAKSTATGLAGITEGAEGLHGDDYLKTLPSEMSGTVRAIGEGRQTLSSRQLSTPAGRALNAQVHQAYPDYNESNAKTWQDADKKFRTNPKVISYNTALEHMQDLYQNTNGEGIFNPVSKEYQDRQVALGYVTREVGNAISTGVLAQEEGKDILNRLSGGLTPGNKRERIAETARLLHDKIEEFQEQYKKSAPSSAVKVPLLMSPKAVASYDFVQSDGKTQQPQPQTQQAQPQLQKPAGVTMKVPGSDGKMYWSDGKQNLGVAE